MMLSDPILNVVVSIVSILGLWIIVFRFYRDYSIDHFRQEMFRLRDSLFDEASAGLIPFDHPSYGLLRSTMNGFIRFGHRVGLLQLALAIWITRSVEREGLVEPFRKRWEAAVRGLGQSKQEKLEMYLLQMNLIVVRRFLLGAPVVVMTVVLPILLWVVIRISLERVLAILRRPIDNIDAAALAYGE